MKKLVPVIFRNRYPKLFKAFCMMQNDTGISTDNFCEALDKLQDLITEKEFEVANEFCKFIEKFGNELQAFAIGDSEERYIIRGTGVAGFTAEEILETFFELCD